MFLLSIILCAIKLFESVKIKDVVRTITVQNHYIEIKSDLSIENDGNTIFEHFTYYLDPIMKANISYISASVQSSKIGQLFVDHQSDLVTIKYPNALKPGSKTKIQILEIYIHIMVPFPATVTQFDSQMVLLRFNNFLYSDFAVESQTTSVIIPDSTSIRSADCHNPWRQAGSTVILGPYKVQGPFKKSSAEIHFTNSRPFVTIKNHLRIIMISEWGSIRIEEDFMLFHEGANFQGSFNRLQFSMNPTKSVVSEFDMILPPDSHHIYYRDDIGNISTSEVIQHAKYTKLKLYPRFPIFGGWHAHYTVGYQYPSFSGLFKNPKESDMSSERMFSVPLTGSPMSKYVIDNLELQLVLPFSAKVSKITIGGRVFTHYEIIDTFGYLDVFGRPTVVIRQEKLTSHQNDIVKIYFELDSKMLFFKPFYVSGLLLFGLLFISFVIRVDLSLIKDDKKSVANFLNAQIRKIRSYESSVLASFSKFMDEVDKFKTSTNKSKLTSCLESFSSSYAKVQIQILQTVNLLKNHPSNASKTSHYTKQINLLDEKMKTRKKIAFKEVEIVTKAADSIISRDKYSEESVKLQNEHDTISKTIQEILSSF